MLSVVFSDVMKELHSKFFKIYQNVARIVDKSTAN